MPIDQHYLDNSVPQELSGREAQVYLGLAKGVTATQIGRQLGLSVKTVSTYRSRLLEKLGLRRNADITFHAIEHRHIQLEILPQAEGFGL